MLHYLEVNHAQMKSAPPDLIKPVTDLVVAALDRNKNGEINFKGWQSSVLFDPETGMEIRLDNANPLPPHEPTMPHDGGCGLFVTTHAYMPDGQPSITLDSVQIPSRPSMVTVDEIYLLRAITPESLQNLADAIVRANKVQVIDVVPRDGIPDNLLLPSEIT